MLFNLYFKKVLFLLVAFKLFSIEMQTLLIKSLCFVYMLVNYSARQTMGLDKIQELGSQFYDRLNLAN